MATYADTLDILGTKYWEGGETLSGGDTSLGAEHYLTDPAWDNDALSENPWLAKYLPQITGAGSGWDSTTGAGTSGDPFTGSGSFRNLQAYTPFAERAAFTGDMPSFAEEGIEFDSTMWDEKGRGQMGIYGAISALAAKEGQMEMQLGEGSPYGTIPAKLLDINPGMRSLGFTGGDLDGRDNWSEMTPESGSDWDNLNWNLGGEGRRVGFDSKFLGAPGTDIGNDYYREFYGESGGQDQMGNQPMGTYTPRFSGAMGNSPLYNPWHGSIGKQQGLFKGTSTAANTSFSDMENSSQLPSRWSETGYGDPSQGYQNLFERVGRGLKSSSNQLYGQGGWGGGAPDSRSYLDRVTKSGTQSDSQDPYRFGLAGQSAGNYASDLSAGYHTPQAGSGGGYGYSMLPGITGRGGEMGGVLDTGTLNLTSQQATPWQQMFSSKEVADTPGMGYSIPEGVPTDAQKEALAYQNQMSMTGPENNSMLGAAMTGPFRSSFDLADENINSSDYLTDEWAESDVLGQRQQISEQFQREPFIKDMANSSATAVSNDGTVTGPQDPFSNRLVNYIRDSSNKPPAYVTHKADEQAEIGSALGESLRRSSAYGPAQKMENIYADATMEGTPLQTQLGQLQTGELAAREAMLRGEVGGMRSFNKSREGVIGDRATGGLKQDVYNAQGTAHDEIVNEFNLFQGEGAPGTATEGSRTALMRGLFGHDGEPGSLRASRLTGDPANYGQKLEDTYQGYRTDLQGLVETKDSDVTGLGGIASNYSIGGSATGDTSSKEYKAREKFKNKWETDILPGYEGDVAGKRESYDTDLSGLEKVRRDEIKETIKGSRTDLRDVDAKIRDLDLAGIKSRREIRGFEGGGLRSGKRSRLGGEEYQKLMEDKRQLLEERKGIKSSKKSDISQSREDARVDINQLTGETQSEIFDLQSEDSGVEFDIKEAARESAEDLTTAEQNLWGESETTERTALDAVQKLEADASTTGSVAETISNQRATEEASYDTKLSDAKGIISGGKTDLVQNIFQQGGNKAIVPDLAKKLYSGSDSLMSQARSKDTRDLAVSQTGETYGNAAATPLKDIEQGRKDYMSQVSKSAPWSLQNLENKARSTFGSVKAAGAGTGKYGSFANTLRDDMQKRALGAIGQERGDWQKSLYDHYMGGGSPINAAEGDQRGWMPDLFSRKGGNLENRSTNLFGQTYWPTVVGDTNWDDSAGAYMGRSGSEAGTGTFGAQKSAKWSEPGYKGFWDDRGDSGTWEQAGTKAYAPWGYLEQHGASVGLGPDITHARLPQKWIHGTV